MRVAMLVHNSVLGDARVRKEARSLQESGHVVDLFGLGESPIKRVEGCELNLVSPHVSNSSVPILWIRSLLLSRLRQLTNLVRNCLTEGSGILTLLGWFTSAILLSTNFSITVGLVFFLLGLVYGFYRATRRERFDKSVFIILTRVSLVCVFLSFFLSFPQIGLGGCVLISVVILISSIISDLDELFGIFNLFRIGYLIRAKALASAVDPQRYQVVHCHDMIALIAGVLLKKKHNHLKLIWDAHEIYPELAYKVPQGRRTVTKFIKQCSPFVDGFITINQSIGGYYKIGFTSLPDAVVLMNATRRSLYKPEKNDLMRRATKICDDQKILLFQGGLSPGRGVEKLLEVAAVLPKSWSVIFMGSGPLENMILRKIGETNHNEDREEGRKSLYLIPPAPYEELSQWTSAATIGAILYENTSLNHLLCTPNKLWEYPNAGVPILASNLQELGRIVSEEQIGWVISLDSEAEDIASVIASLREEDISAKKDACQRFSEIENWEKYEPSLYDLYSKILK